MTTPSTRRYLTRSCCRRSSARWSPGEFFTPIQPSLKPAPTKPNLASNRLKPLKSKRAGSAPRIQPAAICSARTSPAQRLFYLDHRTVDGKHNIIAGTHVAPGNVHDSIPYLGRLDRQRERFGFEVEAMGLDAGYYTAAICKGIEDRGISGVLAYSRLRCTARGICPKVPLSMMSILAVFCVRKTMPLLMGLKPTRHGEIIDPLLTVKTRNTCRV